MKASKWVRSSSPGLGEAQLGESNVDSVVLSWSIQAQASMWMTDCFSSVFSDSASESMALAYQLSCLVAENKLQITDTDFAKQFKALARNKLIELRNQWQAHSCVSSGSNG
jgi:hypothetical protein